MRRQSNVRARFSRSLRLFPFIVAIFGFVQVDLRAQTAAAASTNASKTASVLTNAADVLALSVQEAKRNVPVIVRGVVTEAEPSWGGQFFVQDETSGVFVENRSDDHPEPGDLVEVKGVSQPGFYAPIISRPTWTVLGT